VKKLIREKYGWQMRLLERFGSSGASVAVEVQGSPVSDTALGALTRHHMTCSSRRFSRSDGVSEGTRTPDTQDHNDVVELQPFLGVDEIFLAWVLAELRLKGCDDPAYVVLGAPVGSGHEDHAVVSRTAGQHGIDV
jgi:hypothetical protein